MINEDFVQQMISIGNYKLSLFEGVMNNSKSTILSKAEKMKIKSAHKNSPTPPIIQITDSDDSNHKFVRAHHQSVIPIEDSPELPAAKPQQSPP